MSIFQPVTIIWCDHEYTVPANKVMGLIAEIEEHITIYELSSRANMSLTKLAAGYSAAIRYAGGRVSQEEVYEFLFKDSKQIIPSVIQGLLMMMVPPNAVEADATNAEVAPGKN